MHLDPVFYLFSFSDTATTDIYTLSLQTLFRSRSGEYRAENRARRHHSRCRVGMNGRTMRQEQVTPWRDLFLPRSEEHTSELQSPYDTICRTLLEKGKQAHDPRNSSIPPLNTHT